MSEVSTVDLSDMMQRKVVVETHEGAVQAGMLTKVNYFQTDVNGKVTKSIKSIELNNDASEFVDWHLVARIRLARA